MMMIMMMMMMMMMIDGNDGMTKYTKFVDILWWITLENTIAVWTMERSSEAKCSLPNTHTAEQLMQKKMGVWASGDC